MRPQCAISIILPVYNSEEWLEECITSILNQTFHDFELIIINDGSTDSSFNICNKFSHNSHVCLLNKENGGVSSARNMGLEYANGKWITFVDSDDYIKNTYLQELYDKVSPNVDLVFSYPLIVYADGRQRYLQYKSRLVNDSNFDDAFVNNALYEYTSPWAKLYNGSIIRTHNLRFCNGMPIGEDLLFLFTYMLFIDRFYITSAPIYYYRYNISDTLTKKVNSYGAELFCLHNICEVLDELKSRKNILSERTTRKFNWIRGYYTRRVLNSLYHGKIMSHNCRCECIRKLDVSSYLNEIQISSRKEAFLAYLLRKGYVRTYDLIRYAVCLLR